MSMKIEQTPFGTTRDGREVIQFTLTNGHGMQADILTFGAVVRRLLVPDADGNTADVVLGYDSLAPYEAIAPFFGAVVGRYGNRIGGAAFDLDGVTYRLTANDGRNHLHGGPGGFGGVVWTPRVEECEDGPVLVLTYFSPDGEEGYPGNLTAETSYSLTEDNRLRIRYRAITDRATVVNLTNHSYFNLTGHGSGSILDHRIRIHAGFYTPTDEESIPTGEIRSVAGTPLDLTQPVRIGDRVDDAFEQLSWPHGFDNNWVLPSDGTTMILAADVEDPASGRTMEVWTSHRGVQFYTGNGLKGRNTGKDGVTYVNRAGFCLETQFYPDSIHHAHFPSPVLRPGEVHEATTEFAFRHR